MTNNIVQVTEGSGKNVATETIGSTDYQKVKIIGADVGSTSTLTVNPDGSIKASVIGTVTANIASGSLVATVTGSIVTIQSGTVRASVISSTPSSMLVGASIFGPLPAGTATIGAVTAPAGSVLTVATLAGSVMAVSGTLTPNPGSVSGAVTAPPGSVMTVATLAGSVVAVSAVQPAGSVLAVTATQSGTQVTSLVSTVPSSVIVGASIFGQLPGGTAVLGSVATLQGTNPWTVVNPAASVTAVSAVAPPGSVMTIATLAGSIMAVSATQSGTQITSIVSTVPSSVIVGASIFGQLPAGTATIGAVTAPSGSILSVTIPAGSVTGVRTDNASVVTTQIAGSVMGVRTDLASVITVSTNVGSIITVPIGSVITIQQAQSIVGTYAEDAAHTTADKGLFVFQVRNDTMASITSADGDYSPIAGGPIGETIIANAPITKWITAQTSVMYGVSVQAIAAQGASVFTYVTGLQVANDSATFSRVKITGGLGSVLAWTVAPANGGSNIIFPNPLRGGDNSGISASISGISSVYISMQGFIAKA